MVGIMLIFPWILDSIALIQCPRVAEVFLWLVLCLYFRGYTRLDSLDTVPSCSLSILMVGIMLIFPCPRV